MNTAEHTSPMVSVIVPAYNAASHIEAAITSIVNQSYPSIEIVVVDDGSDDGTAHLVRSYPVSNRRISCIEMSNSGVSTARNVGISHARGEYCMFVDSDDRLLEGAVSALVGAAEANRADFTIGGMRFVKRNRNDEETAARESFISPFRCSGAKEVEPHLEPMIVGNYIQSSCSKCYRTDFLRENSLRFDSMLDSFEDMAFVLACVEASECFCAVADVCYEYSLRSEKSNSRRYKENMAWQMDRVGSYIRGFCSRTGIRPDVFGPTLLHLFVNAVNSTIALHKANDAAEIIENLYTNPSFDLLPGYQGPYPNRYSKTILHFVGRGEWMKLRFVVRLRNIIRAISGQPV